SAELGPGRAAASPAASPRASPAQRSCFPAGRPISGLMSSAPSADAGRGAGARRPAAALEREFCALLEQYPTAPLIPVTENGLITDMPDSVPRRENPVLKGRAALDGVPAEDHARLIAAFDTLLE